VRIEQWTVNYSMPANPPILGSALGKSWFNCQKEERESELGLTLYFCT